MPRRASALSVLLFTALGVFIFFGGAPLVSDEAFAAPRMAFKEQIYDFKNVLEGEILTHTFQVMNEGDEPLRIEEVKPGCSCSVVDFDPIIPPKGAGKMTVKIDTKGFDGPERWGVKVFSNDPTWKEAVLDLRADVKQVITLSGTAVLFKGKNNTIITREVDISARLDKPLTLTPTQFTLSGKMTYSLSEIEKEKRYRVTFQNVPGQNENYRGFLKLKTNFAEKPEVIIWIIGRFEK